MPDHGSIQPILWIRSRCKQAAIDIEIAIEIVIERKIAPSTGIRDALKVRRICFFHV